MSTMYLFEGDRLLVGLRLFGLSLGLISLLLAAFSLYMLLR